MDKAQARQAFEAAIGSDAQAFGDFFLSRWLGLAFSYEDDACTVRFQAREFMFNPQGSLHGGIVATVMDISMGHLLHRAAGAGATLEMKTQYVRPGRAGPMRCVGRFVHAGRGTSFLSSTLYDDQGQVLAFATSTWKHGPPPATITNEGDKP
jgi:uncharacterized protein (TIGR00369 family)